MYIVPCAAMVMELFLYCYYGNKLTTKSFELLDSVYQSTWYEYPIRYQRYVQLMMVRMQRPMVLTGYDVVLCNLPTFTTVRGGAITISELKTKRISFRFFAPSPR